MPSAFSRARKIILACGVLASVTAHAQTDEALCEKDLAYLPDFLLRNDAGVLTLDSARQRAAVESAIKAARSRSVEISDRDSCLELLNVFLKTYRRGHLWIQDSQRSKAATPSSPGTASDNKPDPQIPTFRLLSAHTALLVVPSFYIQYREPLIGLLKKHAEDISTRRNLLIDVRLNGGGSDATYYALMPRIVANAATNIGVEFLATEDNAKGIEYWIRQQKSEPLQDAVRRIQNAMRAHPAGSFVRVPGIGESGQTSQPEAVTHPARIGILIGQRCGSSCEQFLLEARQSYKTKLFGRNTAGALDYSNMAEHGLPSGQRTLFYATSRSARLPLFPVDASGIQPDQFFPAPANAEEYEAEIAKVQAILEAMPGH
ncbi:S41 family peptidase [Uliginosibacterium sp. H1]|uniref:S41 family peptidase n=1 Tax=Uliginosibacterium sp. H1 TaxID=3114757 RepID=UPI002E19F4F4|nr:S41 family peptidase [Uliginosibacterium sp. H1]